MPYLKRLKQRNRPRSRFFHQNFAELERQKRLATERHGNAYKYANVSRMIILRPLTWRKVALGCLESKGAATTEAFKPWHGKFPHWSSLRGEFKPRDSGVTAIMAHHAPPPIDISIASSVTPSTVLEAGVPVLYFDQAFPCPPRRSVALSLSLSKPTPCLQPPPRRRLHPSSLLCASLSSFVYLSLPPPSFHCVHSFFLSLLFAVESCNRDLAHPYRDNDRSPVDTVADIYGGGGAMLKQLNCW